MFKRYRTASLIAMSVAAALSAPTSMANDYDPYELRCYLEISHEDPFHPQEVILPRIYYRIQGSRIWGSDLASDEALALTRRDVALNQNGEVLDLPPLQFTPCTLQSYIGSRVISFQTSAPTVVLSESELQDQLMSLGGLSETQTENLGTLSVSQTPGSAQVHQSISDGGNSFHFGLVCSDVSRGLISSRVPDGPFRLYDQAQSSQSSSISDESIRVIQKPTSNQAPPGAVQTQSRE